MRVFYSIALAIVICGCDIFDKDEQIPSWVLINSSSLVTNEGTEGAATADIVDATVFADDFFVGTFELPAAVPILAEGPTRITVAPGIKNNGLTSNRVIYPYYQSHEEVVDLIPSVKHPLGIDTSLTYTYFPNINFFLEGFEEALAPQLGPRPDNNATFERVLAVNQPENVRSGAAALEVILTPETDIFEAETTAPIPGLTTLNPTYMEIDFKGEHPLEIGVIGISQEGETKVFALGINPQAEWTKVYVELTNEIGSLVGSFAYKFTFESRLQGLSTERRLYIDNIKIVYL